MSEYNGCFVEDEIDASNVFKQAASNLSTVNTLDESLNRFGYNSDDRIERRELVLMYSSIKDEMENEIHNLAHDSAYDAAKAMRSRLTGLKGDFGALQTNGAKLVRDDQVQLFDQGSTMLLGETKARHAEEVERVMAEGEALRRDLAKTHEIQQENLEKTLMRRQLPHTKYSKRLIELFKAESGLIKLCEYEEARKVRNMIDKILPGEVKKNEEVFEQNKQQARVKLAKDQHEDWGRLEEKIKALVWKDKRRRETELCREEQRVTNNMRDMNHAHFLEGRLRAEMSVKPSALWQKRPGYQTSSASLRGQQLLDTARGKEEGNTVFADSLVDKHDYSGSLSGTQTLS
mmetsp:Transcript_6717/g.11025  ORF Transcript_6717/g.11025 Transcript_6717/m.11025 type:complete len:346 (+) Transcript_6717:63-1100(+)